MPEVDQNQDAPSRRERLAKISSDFTPVPLRPGTQQSGAIEEIREHAQELAKMIAVLCPEGPEQQTAIAKVMEAKMWATQAISHRGSST